MYRGRVLGMLAAKQLNPSLKSRMSHYLHDSQLTDGLMPIFRGTILQLQSLNNNYDSLYWKENNFVMTPLHHFLFLWFVCFSSSLKEENPFSQFSFAKYAAKRTLPTHTLQHFRYQYFHPGLDELFLNPSGGNMVEIFAAREWKTVVDANTAISALPPFFTAVLNKLFK